MIDRVPESEEATVRVEPAEFGHEPVVEDAPFWLAVKPPEVVPWLPEAVEGALGDVETDTSVETSEKSGTSEGLPTKDGASPGTGSGGPTPEEHEAALEAVRNEVTEALQEPCRRAVAHLHETAQRLERELDGATVQMAVELASAILTHEASVDPDVLRSTIRAALETAGPVVEISLRVHPEDLDWTRAEAPAMANEVSGQSVTMSVSASSEVDRGTCVAQFSRGIVDARWSTQLRHLADAARQALEDAPYPQGETPDPGEEME